MDGGGVAQQGKQRRRGDMLKGIDADYYGYRDDDDGTLQPLEKAYENEGTLPLPPPAPTRRGTKAMVAQTAVDWLDAGWWGR